MYNRIITHADFDGLISAAIASHALNVNFIVFTQPRLVAEARISITKKDVVCDLPYPLECGMWFDHHDGNTEELEYRNIKLEDIPGKFEVLDSCARVVYNHFSNMELPAHFEEMVAEADIIDSFKYKDIEDWRSLTPGKIIDSTIKLKEASADRKWEYLRNLVRQLKTRSLPEVAEMPSVHKRFKIYQEEEERMLEQVESEVTFLDYDSEKKVILLDLTRHNRRPMLLKHLAYLMHPDAQAVLSVSNVFDSTVKTNDLVFSMSLNLNMNKIEHNKDIGEIMRTLNLGSGHSGAAAGTQTCASKEEMIKEKERLLKEIYTIFTSQ